MYAQGITIVHNIRNKVRIYSYRHVLLQWRKVNTCVYATKFSLNPINITITHNVQIKIVLWWTELQRLKNILKYVVFQTTTQHFSWYYKAQSRYSWNSTGNSTQDKQCPHTDVFYMVLTCLDCAHNLQATQEWSMAHVAALYSLTHHK